MKNHGIWLFALVFLRKRPKYRQILVKIAVFRGKYADLGPKLGKIRRYCS